VGKTVKDLMVVTVEAIFETGTSESVGRVAGRSGDRILVGARFSAPVQTGPDAHQASCTMGTGSFPEESCGRGVTLTPNPLLALRSKLE